jgi:spore maturation protein SpmA
MNIIWLILIAVSIVAAVFTGRLEALTQALFDWGCGVVSKYYISIES